MDWGNRTALEDVAILLALAICPLKKCAFQLICAVWSVAPSGGWVWDRKDGGQLLLRERGGF